MKIMKKFSAIVLASCLCTLCFSMAACAADGRISFSDPDTAVGEMVEVKCQTKYSGGSIESLEIRLSYDSSFLRFDSGDEVREESPGTLVCTPSGGSGEVSFYVTFQALQEGSTKITVAGETVTSQSGSALDLDYGNATVTIAEGDPSRIVEQTAASATDMEVEIDGVSYTLTDSFADADIPEGYERTAVSLEGADRQMITGSATGLTLAYLIDAGGAGDFYIYNSEDATFAPYGKIDISETAFIIVLSDTSKVSLPEKYQEGTLTLNDKVFPVWQDMEDTGYYLLYALSSSGMEGLYRYDTQDGTYQRFTAEVEEEEVEAVEEEEDSWTGRLQDFLGEYLKFVVTGVGAVFGFLLLVLLVTAVKLRNRNLELDALYDEYGIDLEPEKPEESGKESRKQKEDDFDDYGEEDDYDAYEEYGSYESLDDDYYDDYDDGFDDGDDDERYGDKEKEREDNDIFADEDLEKYNTRNYQDLSMTDTFDRNGLEELFEDLSGEEKHNKKESHAFNVDFVDLD